MPPGRPGTGGRQSADGTGGTDGTDDVAVRKDRAAHRFEVRLGGDVAGFLAYREYDEGAYAFAVRPR